MAPAEVLFFSFSYPPRDGGVARLCAELVAGLQRRGCLGLVLSQRCDAPGSAVPAAPERRIARGRPWLELAALRVLRRAPPEAAVICGLWYPEGLLAVLAGRRPAAILAHGLEIRPTRERWRRWAWRWLMGWVLRRAQVVVANSGYTADLVRRRAPKANVAALPLGVDHRRFCPGDPLPARRRFGVAAGQLVILSVSRLLPHKGHRLVFRALAAAAPVAAPDFVYLIAGQGRDMVPLQRDVQALGLETMVRWLGYVPESELPELYRSANLFVLCTREDDHQPEVEGFGLAFLEAQACGIPVVGTRTGGIADAIVKGQGGWLIDQDDVAALTAILLQLAANPESFRRMGLTARQRVERESTWDHYVDRLIVTLRVHAVSICEPRVVSGNQRVRTMPPMTPRSYAGPD